MRLESLLAIVALSIVAPASAASGPRTDLSAYVGKYPYDVVQGHRFFDHPMVKAAIARAVPNARTRAVVRSEDDSVNLPIIRVAGGRILAWAGSKRSEDVSNWAVVIAPNGSKPEICIHDSIGLTSDFKSSEWFEPGQPAIMKIGTCPSTKEDYPAKLIAAG